MQLPTSFFLTALCACITIPACSIGSLADSPADVRSDTRSAADEGGADSSSADAIGADVRGADVSGADAADAARAPTIDAFDRDSAGDRTDAARDVRTVACLAPFRACGGTCVNLATSESHCGACDSACTPGLSCVDGRCTGRPVACIVPLRACSGVCVDLRTDRDNCGACGTRCARLQTCRAGTCQL